MVDATGVDIGTQPAPTLDQVGQALRETADSNPLARLSSEERQAWDRDGKLPAGTDPFARPAAKPDAGDDAPAVDAKGAAITEGGRPLSKRDQRTRELIQRGVQDGIALERQARERLERELAELKGRGGQPAAQPGATPPAAKPDADKEPVLDDFLDQPDPYIAWTRAVTKWDLAQARKAEVAERQTQTQAAQLHEGVMARVTAHTARQQALAATVPDYDAKTLSIREQMDMRSPLALAVVESDVSEHLILHLAEHPEDFERIGVLGVTNMPAALREIGRLEAKFTPGSTPASVAAPATATKHVSSAPAPPTTLGSRSADPADASKAALSRGDFRSFNDIETAKDLAAAGRR